MLKRNISLFIGCCLALPVASHAFSLKHGMVPVQFGFFGASQGVAQDINIQGLIGNQYSSNNHQGTSGLFGTGYFVDTLERDRFQLAAGINGYYFGKTGVSGTIAQEHLFTNLNYHYTIQNTPVYLAAKARVKNSNDKYNIIVDAGIGPNFMRTANYTETPLTSYSLPDNNAFPDKTSTTLSVMAGAGLRMNNVFGKLPLECGYRFFYFGQGQFNTGNNQILNALKTGNTYANAVVCSVNV